MAYTEYYRVTGLVVVVPGFRPNLASDASMAHDSCIIVSYIVID